MSFIDISPAAISLSPQINANRAFSLLATSKTFFNFPSATSTRIPCARSSAAAFTAARRVASPAVEVTHYQRIFIRLRCAASTLITRRSSPIENPMPGNALRAERFGQPVIAPAAQHRILRAQRPMHNLECRAHVIVQAAHHARPHFVGNPVIVQMRFHRVEMRPARLAQMILDGWQRFDDGLILGHFAIQHAQRIRYRAALAIVAHARRHVAQLFLAAAPRTAGGNSDRRPN